MYNFNKYITEGIYQVKSCVYTLSEINYNDLQKPLEINHDKEEERP
jgi:hypothetical protein